jgi:hypothetical protein
MNGKQGFKLENKIKGLNVHTRESMKFFSLSDCFYEIENIESGWKSEKKKIADMKKMEFS